MKLRNVAFYILLSSAALWLASCGKQTTEAPVAEASPEKQYPSRIITMAPSITEIAFALGLGDRVVGTSDFSDYPIEAREKPKIGGLVNPNMEAIVALDPDLVIALPNATHESLYRTLRQLGIKVLTLPNDTLEDMFNTISVIGKETRAEKAADEMAARLHARFSEVNARVADRPRRKVMFVVGIDPLFVAGKGTFIDELIAIAGGTNIAGDSISKYPQLGIEEVVARAPYVILYTSLNFELTPEQEAKARKMWSAYPAIPAVRDGRIYGLVADYVTLPGPRLATGIEEMARAIHPEAFGHKEQSP